jgi:cytochrome P450
MRMPEDPPITTPLQEWDPISAWQPRVDADQGSSAEIYAKQRATCPFTLDTTERGQRMWHAFRARDVAEILINTDIFSSAVPKFGKPIIPIELDPPTHGIFRRLLSNMMAPRRILKYETSIRAFVVAELESLIAAGGGDFVPLTYRIPIRAFCLLVGETDDGTFSALDQAARAAAPPFTRQDAQANAQRVAAIAPLMEFCRERLRERRGNPRDDLASDIANGQINGSLVDEDDATRMLLLIYMAGHDTSAMGIQGAISLLAKDSEAQSALRSNPGKIPAAIEECLRLESPLHTLPRYCTRDTTLGGRAVKSGDQVYPVFGAANVDPDGFVDPEVFDLDRKPHHFAFGRGIHTCPGAPLARTEIRVLLEELLGRTDHFTFGKNAARKPWPRNGYTELPIVLHACTSKTTSGILK